MAKVDVRKSNYPKKYQIKTIQESRASFYLLAGRKK